MRAHASGNRSAKAARSAASARAMPSSMFVVKYSVPVAGMTSTWNAIPERSSIVEPAEIGELTHSSRWSWCPGLRKMPKNGSPRWRVDDRRAARPPVSADAHRAVPLGDRREVRRHQPIDVVADPLGQLVRRLDHEPGPAGERAPDAEGGREPIAALDRPIARAEQPERGARPGGQHEVARQRPAVPAEQRAPPRAPSFPVAGPRSSRRTPCEVWQLAHSNAASCSTSLMTRRPSAGVDEQVGGVLDRPGCPDQSRAARRRGRPAGRSCPARA